MRTLLNVVGAVALCLAYGAWADDVAVETAAAPQTREPIKDIPQSKPNSDKRIEESMSIPTEMLHGFSMDDAQRQVAEKIALLVGATDGQTGPHPSEAGFGEYRIGAGDILEFTLFNDPEPIAPGATSAGRLITVRYDGFISLPRISDIKIEGMTRTEAEEAIERAYGVIYRNPELSLTVVTPDSKAYSVTGDVQIPGRYAYTRETSLWDAISLAGGLRLRNTSGGTDFVAITGQISKAFVIRRVNGERSVLSYDLRGFGSPGAWEGDAEIYYGDIVYVPEGVSLVYLLGENRSPVIVELTEGMTLLQMLSLSGGFNSSTAKLNNVILLRQVDDETTDIHRINLRQVLKNKEEDMLLQPGDIVYIPQKTMVRLSEFVLRFTSSISPLLDMYTLGVDALFAYDLNDESLEALENENVSVGVRSTPAGGVSRVPRVISAPNLAPASIRP